MSFLQIAISVGGLAILVLVLVEGAGLLRSVRRCSVETKKGGWKEDAVRKEVGEQAAKRQENRKQLMTKWTTDLKDFQKSLAKAPKETITVLRGLGLAGFFLFIVLAPIHVLYYAHFDFDVLEYLPGYSLPAIMLSLLQTLILLFLFLISIFVGVLVLPWTGLLLVKIFDGTRPVVARALADSFFTLCRHSMTCHRLASKLLGDAPASNTGGTTGEDPQDDTPATSASKKNGAKTVGSKLIYTVWSLLFLFACFILILFESKYRTYATCHGTRSTRVVLDPPLRDATSFTKIGQIGEHVFIVPLDSCGSGKSETTEDQPGITDEVGTEENGARPGDDDGVAGTVAFAIFHRYVFDPIWDRLEFLCDSDLDESQEQPADVTVVPISRVLCMYEDHEGRSGRGPETCGPPQPPVVGIPVFTGGRTNIWVMGVPSEVRMRMDYEWRVKEEIATRLCNGGEAVVSEPVVFKRGASTLTHAQRVQEAIEEFLNEPELQGVKLHVLGFASGDGNRRYNEDLAARRAEAVAAEVRELDGDRMVEEVSWGENHLTNGVANSRSVRLVGCLPAADIPTDASG